MKNEKSLKSIICYLRKSEKGHIKTQSKEMKDIIKIRANINGKEKKKINKTKIGFFQKKINIQLELSGKKEKRHKLPISNPLDIKG